MASLGTIGIAAPVAAIALVAGAKLLQELTRQICYAAARGKSELVISLHAKVAAAVNALFPEMTAGVLGLTATALPGDGGIGRASLPGRQSTSALSPSILTTLIDKASVRNNEIQAPG